MHVIQKTGAHLLKYSKLYGNHFTSVIDRSALGNISGNKFDIDLLLLCGDRIKPRAMITGTKTTHSNI